MKHALQYVSFRVFLRDPAARLLAPPPSAAELPAPGRELLLLFLLGSAVSLAVAALHGDGLRLRPGGGSDRSASEAKALRGPEHGPEPRNARVLQVLQFLRGEPPGRAGAGRDLDPPGAIERGPSDWHLVLYFPVDELC